MSYIKYIATVFLAFCWTVCLEGALKVTSVSPSSGISAGGNVALIEGRGFNSTTEVNFGSRPASSFSVISDTKIIATVPPGTPGTVDVTVSTSIHTSQLSTDDFYTYTQSAWQGILSVLNQDSVTLFDTGTNTISATIPLAADSLASIITPDGTTLYAIDSSAPSVFVIDAATNTITGTIPLPPIVGPGGFDMIVNPNGDKLYVSNNSSGYVTVIDIPSNLIDANIPVVSNLGALSITPDGKTVYVANFNFTADTIAVIDATTNTLEGFISTGFSPGSPSITPNGIKGFVGNSLTDTVSVIDIATNTVTNNIVLPAGAGPYGTSILPNGQTLYVANIYNSTVTVIDVATETIIQTILFPPGSGPFWAAATPDGKTVYIANLNTSDVTPIDVATNTAGPAIASVPGSIQDLSMSPDPAPVASFFASGTVIGLPTRFDASASLSPIGTIVSYAWDFGDGTTLTTPSPIVNHTYTSERNFHVVLTVTNSAGTSTSKVYLSRFMSNNGGQTAVFRQKVGISPSSPTNLKGKQKCIERCCRTDIVNILTWDPPVENINPAYYAVYRDAALTQLLAKIPQGQPLVFVDSNRKEGKVYTYYVVAVSPARTVSPPASVSIQPKRCRSSSSSH